MEAVEAATRLWCFLLLPCATLCLVLGESPKDMERLYSNFVPIFDDDFVGRSRTGRHLADLSLETHFGDSNSLNLGELISEKRHPVERVLNEVAAPKPSKMPKDFFPSPVDKMADRIGKTLAGGQWQNRLKEGEDDEPHVLIGSDREFVVKARHAVVSEEPREVATHHSLSHNGGARLQMDIVDVSPFQTSTMQSPIQYKELEQTTEASLVPLGKEGVRATPANDPFVMPHQVERGTGKIILPHYKTASSHHQRQRPKRRKLPQYHFGNVNPLSLEYRTRPTTPPSLPPSQQNRMKYRNAKVIPTMTDASGPVAPQEKRPQRGNMRPLEMAPSGGDMSAATDVKASIAATPIPPTATITEADAFKNIPELFETLPKASHLTASAAPEVPLMKNQSASQVLKDEFTRNGFDKEGDQGTETSNKRTGSVKSRPEAGHVDQFSPNNLADESFVAYETKQNSSLIYSTPRSEVADNLGSAIYNQLAANLNQQRVVSPTTARQIEPLIVYGTHRNINTIKKRRRIDDFVPSIRISNSVNPGDAIFYSNRPMSDSEYSQAVEAGSLFHAPDNLIRVDQPVAKKPYSTKRDGGIRGSRSDYNVAQKLTRNDHKGVIFPTDEKKKNMFEPSVQIEQFYLDSEDEYNEMKVSNSVELTATERLDSITSSPAKLISATAKTNTSTTKRPSERKDLSDNPRWPKSNYPPQQRKKVSGNVLTHSESKTDFSSFRVAKRRPQTAKIRPGGQEAAFDYLNDIHADGVLTIPPPKKSQIVKTAQKELFDDAGGRRLKREGLLNSLMRVGKKDNLWKTFSVASATGSGVTSPRTSKLLAPDFQATLAPLAKHPLAPGNLMWYVDQGFRMVTKWVPSSLTFLGPERQYHLK